MFELASLRGPRPLLQTIGRTGDFAARLAWRGWRRILLAAVVTLAARASASTSASLVEQPLRRPAASASATLFTEVPAAQTGVVTENHYADPEMWAKRFQEFKFGAIGTGIAVGDYDNDGRPDLFVVSKTESSRLFRNLGSWKFEDVTARAGLAGPEGMWDKGVAWVKGLVGSGGATGAASGVSTWKQGAAFADVNNDGWLDLYVCRFGAPNLLFINRRDGTFSEEAAARGLAVTDASGMAAFCDYDRDGWLDVFIQTNLLDAVAQPQGQRDYLFRNNRDGTFTNVTERAGIRGLTQGHAAIWWDYDEDGWPDLYVANDFAPPDQLYRNNRDGTFTDVIGQVVPHTPHSAMGADLGDVNNDGRIDFLVADMAATTHEKDQRGMARIRTLLARVPEDATEVRQTMHNALYLNTGTGRMLEAAHLAGLQASDWTWSVLLEDLDCDGRIDVYFTNGMVRELHNADLVQRISGMESIASGIALEKASPVLAEENLAFRNLGDLQFENVSRAWGLAHKGVSFGAALADLDGDGDLDVVVANYQAGVSLLRNDAASGHRAIVALRGRQSNRFGLGATVRLETASGVQVRALVSARGYLSSSEPVAHFGLGADSTIKRLTVEWPSGRRQTFENLPADRRFTVTEPADTPAPAERTSPAPPQFSEVSQALALNVHVPEDSAPAREQPLLPFRFHRRGPALVVADLNQDSQADVVIGGTTKAPAQLRLGGGRSFTAAPLFAAASSLDDGPLLAFDADSDGDLDLLQTKAGTERPAGSPEYQPVLHLNDGAAKFRAAAPDVLPAFASSVGAVVAADFDRDGRLDLFLGGRVLPGRYPQAPRSALWANRRGSFEDVTEALAPALREVGMVTAALATDVDDDGWVDLLLALDWGKMTYFRNRSGRGFEEQSEAAGFAAAGTGWWKSLAAADFNGDGRLDYVAGNAGLNTPYTATKDAPAVLLAADTRPGAAPVLVEAYHEAGRLYPRRSRAELGAQLPTVLRKYPQNNAYARATVSDILGAEALAAARRFAATELQTGVFLSQPDRTFRFVPLPRMAQVAPAHGIIAADFDGDGRADVYAVQNSFAPIPQIGRFDGGLSQLLRGDGRGHFEPVESAASGLVVPGDAKALATLDLEGDGWPDFLVTRNHAPALVFRNNGRAQGRAFGVTLAGRAGNPLAVGARITVELANGTSQTAEVYAGSSYYSQSSATCFFGYPVDAPPRRVLVRWPDGARTEHVLATPPGAVLTLRAPR